MAKKKKKRSGGGSGAGLKPPAGTGTGNQQQQQTKPSRHHPASKRKRSFDRNGNRGRHNANSGQARGRKMDASQEGTDSTVMDDVMAQLRLQRAKAKVEAEAKSDAGSDAGSESIAKETAHEEISADTTQSTLQTSSKKQKKRMGRFYYDPIRKAYFPTASKKYDPNDVRADKSGIGVQQQMRNKRRNQIPSHRVGIVQTAVRLSQCPSLSAAHQQMGNARSDDGSKMRFLVQAYHLSSEITVSARRRQHLRSEMASALLLSKYKVVPIAKRTVVNVGASSREEHSTSVNSSDVSRVEQESAKRNDASGKRVRYKWKSLLRPLPSLPPEEYNGTQRTENTPNDCRCKQELHYSARTFDIMKDAHNDEGTPHIVTIIGGRNEGSSIYYRRNKPLVDTYLLEDNDRGGLDRGDPIGATKPSAWNYLTARFAPFMAGNNPTAVFGALSTSFYPGGAEGVRSRFTIHRDQGIDAASIAAEPFFTAELLQDADNGNKPMYMNDFAWSPDSTSSCPGSVAFAPALVHRKEGLKPSFYDFAAGQLLLQSSGWKFSSEALCVEYLENDSSHQVMYGHRNGAVSLLDRRSGTFSYTGKSRAGAHEYGSTTSLQGVSACDKANFFVSKGSFGVCRLYDIRKLGSARNPNQNKKETPEVVHEFRSPTCGQRGMATGCTGMAVDPFGSTLISTSISANKMPCIETWNLKTGQHMREISLEPLASNYCELSASVTSGIDWPDDNNLGNDALGVWVKSNSHPHWDAPPESGGIHHVRLLSAS